MMYRVGVFVLKADIIKKIEEYLKSQNWKYTYDAEKEVFRFGMAVGNKLKSVNVLIIAGDDFITAYGVLPLNADVRDKENLALVNEFLARANFGTRHGNFELDFRDGELRYKCSLFCGAIVPDVTLVERVVDLSFLMWKRYGNGLLAVLLAGAVPAQEIAKIED
jgi:hypothetical protein